MKFTVHIFADDRLVEPSDYNKLIIKNANVDMIINNIVDEIQEKTEDDSA